MRKNIRKPRNKDRNIVGSGDNPDGPGMFMVVVDGEVRNLFINGRKKARFLKVFGGMQDMTEAEYNGMKDWLDNFDN